MVTKNDFKIVTLRRNNVTVSVREFRTVTGYDVMCELIGMGYEVVGVRYPQRH